MRIDVDIEHADRPHFGVRRSWHFDVDLDWPWYVGALVGPPGAGKSTCSRALFGHAIEDIASVVTLNGQASGVFYGLHPLEPNVMGVFAHPAFAGLTEETRTSVLASFGLPPTLIGPLKIEDYYALSESLCVLDTHDVAMIGTPTPRVFAGRRALGKKSVVAWSSIADARARGVEADWTLEPFTGRFWRK